MRRFWLLLLALPLALACSSEPHASIGNAPSATVRGGAAVNPTSITPTTISWAFWGDADEVTIDQSIVRLFEKEHPEVHVETRSTDYNSYHAQFKQWMQSSDPPDVAFLSDIPAYVPSGVLADLSPLIAADGYDLRDFYPGSTRSIQVKGDIYGIPRDNDTKVIFYNKSLFDAAKLPYPQAGWTWDDFAVMLLR